MPSFRLPPFVRKPTVLALVFMLELVVALALLSSSTGLNGWKLGNPAPDNVDVQLSEQQPGASGDAVSPLPAALAAQLHQLAQHRQNQARRRPLALVFVGTRPEVIKMAPLVHEMQENSVNSHVFDTIVVSTGQHREMLAQTLRGFDLKIDLGLSVMQHNQNLGALFAAVVAQSTAVIASLRPEVVLVQGDTSTALACATAAYYERVPVAHVEAGLRSFDFNHPFPEEMNRRAIDSFATFHFAPTEYAAEAIRRENTCARNIVVTGNTGVDAVLARLNADPPAAARRLIAQLQTCTGGACDVNDAPPVIILVTSHRRENLGEPLESICRAVKRIVEDNPVVRVVFPVHLNPNVQKVVFAHLKNVDRITLTDPLDYDVLTYLLQEVTIVLSDSGGLQEEAVSIGKPVVLLRQTTERPEGVYAGTVRLAGTNEDRVVSDTQNVIDNLVEYHQRIKGQNVFGDGAASGRIANVLRQYLAADSAQRRKYLAPCTQEKQAELANVVYGHS
ncbi:UDP-N-acetylglucosamine 2-epimerase [Capsaspora owczarzaki ATCC 30864]|uniref:UDP-N-acetylglucosamine 2-epimerase (non-hydrolyzing) n=1 Tax=Capsaspora owczarzaki (strain ATCC 30864) TaxID=595528 RepID=A0A0D2WPN9_CAPO3|nr:UDP-N-acetylglucosamine 2-epimerase [Capsaspora owczarzaki ATCC 30864]KJE92658.1 UDP-N-acetylglucosamine 2-epimerase [Capsaspora owczarzaki ATCC 30864]|eukprot:XP_004363305.1 UDP-N-acetylglucosamine 2-epimerase [Capsaspora owczarzaki ATCC 30864]